jgi:hypothetical protein
MSNPTLPPTEADIPEPPEPPRVPEHADHHPPYWRRTTVLAMALAALVTAVITAVVVTLWQDDGDDVSTGTTVTTPAPSSSATTVTTSEPSTTGPSTTTVVAPSLDASTAVYPYASGSLRFADPASAARGFAVDFLGFTDPLFGDFMSGDNRSGEIEVRPRVDGPATTVFVRQLSDDSWWVLGSATGNITVARPAAGATVTSPVTVAGEALAFEGNVIVEVRQDGRTEPIGSGNVTGGGGPGAPFEGPIEFSTPTADYGALVFLTRSEEDGRVWEAATIRIHFG